MTAPLRHLPAWCLLALLVGAGDLFAQRADILPPPRRAETVERAQAFLNPPPLAPLPEGLNNPFAPAAFFGRPATPTPALLAAGPARPAAPSGDQELLENIAPAINPGGTIILGGEPFLLIGQRRVKIGDTLPITFEGTPYVLVITDIQPTTFTLRLNQAELTRPIKSGN
jgi:hypothetical protein